MNLILESIIDRKVEDVFSFCASKEGFLDHFPYKTKWISGSNIWDNIGEILEFKFKIFGIPIDYKTKIVEFKKNEKFVDIMQTGPYHCFRHEHYFEPIGNKTKYTDVLNFSFGLNGIFDKSIAAPITKKLFRKRHQLLCEHLHS